MNFKILFIGGLLLATYLPTNATAQPMKSLYERLGGQASISAVVDDFTTRVLADTRINQKFTQSDPVRFKTQLSDQLCAATGGPCQYTGRDMQATHARMGVTVGEFNALLENLRMTLDKFNVPAAEQQALLDTLKPMQRDIVESESSATGTPLLKKFKPFTTGTKDKTKSKKKKQRDNGLQN